MDTLATMTGPSERQRVAAARFHQDMLDGCQTLKKLGYWPGYFHREVANLGGVRAAKNLLDKPGTSEGFATLWQLGRLDMSVEAFALLPWYAELFTEAERREARARLEKIGFDVESLIGRTRRPSWADA